MGVWRDQVRYVESLSRYAYGAVLRFPEAMSGTDTGHDPNGMNMGHAAIDADGVDAAA